MLVGVGPGAACTTRGVLGVGVPQVTATADWPPLATTTCAGAASGSPSSPTAACASAATSQGVRVRRGRRDDRLAARRAPRPPEGLHWGMATPDPNLPRGTRIRTGIKATLREILFGPARVDDGSMNLVGALSSALGVCGAHNITEFQHTEMVVAPSIKSEGKVQQAQHVGMGIARGERDRGRGRRRRARHTRRADRPGHDPGSRFRLPVQPADRAPRARGERVLRAGAGHDRADEIRARSPRG